MLPETLQGPARRPSHLQQRLKQTLISVLARDRGPFIDYGKPEGDPGLFGPDSVTWRVHADFPGMMAGGVCALMLQTLHPLALAGVWDHSNFRKDLIGRLRRTTAFVAGTTYAARADALKLIDQVAHIHHRVRGSTEDGRPYSADDPDLLCWVHITEVSSFLAGFERYRGGALGAAERDRYFRETSRVAEALGARRVPKSAAGVTRYFQRVQSELCHDHRSAEVLKVLGSIHLPVPGGIVAREVFLGAGAALLPDWANQAMRRGRLDRLRSEAAARSLLLVAPAIRAALTDGVASRSRRRMGLSPASS